MKNKSCNHSTDIPLPGWEKTKTTIEKGETLWKRLESY